MSRHNSKKTHRKRETKRKTLKGGVNFNIFKKIQLTKPVNPKEQLNNFSNEVGHIKIKHFEETLQSKLEILKQLRDKCSANCKEKICSTYASYPSFCEQIQAMIKEKPEYDWSNFCATSGDVIDCKNFLFALKEVEFYVHYITSLSKKSQQLFAKYKPAVTPVVAQNPVTNVSSNSSSPTPNVLSDSPSPTPNVLSNSPSPTPDVSSNSPTPPPDVLSDSPSS